MNPFLLQMLIDLGEQIGIPVLIAVITSELNNPTTQTTFRTAMLGLADSIDKTYGLVPPTHS